MPKYVVDGDSLEFKEARAKDDSDQAYAPMNHDHNGVYSPVGHGHNNATDSTSGFMSGAQKQKLDLIGGSIGETVSFAFLTNTLNTSGFSDITSQDFMMPSNGLWIFTVFLNLLGRGNSGTLELRMFNRTGSQTWHHGMKIWSNVEYGSSNAGPYSNNFSDSFLVYFDSGETNVRNTYFSAKVNSGNSNYVDILSGSMIQATKIITF